MAQADDMNQVVDEIADRVRRRMQALRAGKEQPCTTSPGPSPSDSPSSSASTQGCAPSCDVCPNVSSCGTVNAVKSGAARIAPDAIRTSADIAPYIDHTLLKPEASREEVIKLAEEARKHGFATVCVNSVNVALAARILSGSKTV